MVSFIDKFNNIFNNKKGRCCCFSFLSSDTSATVSTIIIGVCKILFMEYFNYLKLNYFF